MLEGAKIIGFVPTRDYVAARAFYEGKLGFRFVSQDEYAMVLRAGEHMVRVVRTPHMKPAQGTILGWEVRDVEEAVAWLESRGVAMEKYVFAQDKLHGIWTTPHGRVAWFKDADGNVLSVSQHDA
jgi:catechol 2,3-dioxygenase-like lactoylglutathione lyase family enzyme